MTDFEKLWTRWQIVHNVVHQIVKCALNIFTLRYLLFVSVREVRFVIFGSIRAKIQGFTLLTRSILHLGPIVLIFQLIHFNF